MSLLVMSEYPPKITPLVEFDNAVENLATVIKSPKSNAFPVDAMITE